MSEYQSNIARKAMSRLMSEGLTDSSFVCAGVFVSQAEVDLPAGVAAGDTVALTQSMPKGWAVVPHLCSVTKLGSASTALSVCVGDDTDDDRYSAALDLKAAAAIPVKTEFAGGADAAVPAKCADGKPVTAKITFASGVSACKLVFTIAFAAV